jgi:aconitase A
VRLDTRREADHYRHGGVLPYVLRSFLDPRRMG